MDMVVETDPSGRFARSGNVLGQGASKTVYKAFDRFEGREVAWNKALVHGTENTHALLHTEVKVLKSLKHPNIMKFYASWVDEDHGTINFITEYFHTGSLKRHRITHKSFDLRLNPALLKRWAWQILQGLVYLHGHNPPVIHRDLKCDNIFIHGVTGEVKIGDLGLARMMENNYTMCHTCIGTPEFMAPEMYNEEYNEKVDIYSFGMLLLELVTMDYPYSECKTACHIYRNVIEGIVPQSLEKIEDDETRDFIELCIHYDYNNRPSARQLVKHRFFDSVRAPSPKPFCVPSSPELALDETSLIVDAMQASLLGVQSAPESFRPCMITNDMVDKVLRDEMSARAGSDFGEDVSDADDCGRRRDVPYHKASSVASNTDSETSMAKRQFSLQHKGSTALPFVDVINFELCFGDPGATKKLMFSFDVLSDTVEDVGLELEEEYSLTPEETELFTHLLKEELERALQNAPLRSDSDSRSSQLNTFSSVMVSMSLDDWTNKRSGNGTVRASLSGEMKSGAMKSGAMKSGAESGVDARLKSGPKSGGISGNMPSSKAPPLVSFKINMEGNGGRRTTRPLSRYDAVARRRRSIESERRNSIDHKGPRKSFDFERADVWNNLVHHLKGGPTSISKHSVSRYKRCSDNQVVSDDSAMAKKGADHRRHRHAEHADRRQKQKGDKGDKGERVLKRRNSLRISNVSITPVLNQVRMVAGAVKHIKTAAAILCRNSLEGKKVFFEIRGKGGKQSKDAGEQPSDERPKVKGSARFDSRRSMSEPRGVTLERVSVGVDGSLGYGSPTSPTAKHKKSVFGSFRRVASKVWSARRAETDRL